MQVSPRHSLSKTQFGYVAMKDQTAPIPGFEWRITERCNYRCPYCMTIRKSRQLHCSDQTISAIFELLSNAEGSWLIKLIGGEPFLHPRFFEICQYCRDAGHRLSVTTNFSSSFDTLQHLLEVCDEQLDTITASLHLSQVKDLRDFIAKAVAFNARKYPGTNFSVTSVATEESFEQLKEVEAQLRQQNVAFSFLPLKDNTGYVHYQNPEFEQYISNRAIPNIEKIRNRNLFGTFCHTGELFFVIGVNGGVGRCYNAQFLSFLGNISDGTFRRFQKALPCMSPICTCTVPANRNMICFGQKASKYEMIQAYTEGYRRKIARRLKRWLRGR